MNNHNYYNHRTNNSKNSLNLFSQTEIANSSPFTIQMSSYQPAVIEITKENFQIDEDEGLINLKLDDGKMSFIYFDGPNFFQETFGEKSKLLSSKGEEIVNIKNITSPLDLKKGWKIALSASTMKKAWGGRRDGAGRKKVIKCTSCRSSHRRCNHLNPELLQLPNTSSTSSVESEPQHYSFEDWPL